jgi:transcriptional regulator with XRE-family HTH domain
MSDIYRAIGEKIRELRTTYGGQGLSQETLAQKVATTPNTISRWETAAYKPSIADLERLARFFHVPITVFFPGIDANVRVQALLSATGDLDDEELDELTRYALFRKARKALNENKRR